MKFIHFMCALLMWQGIANAQIITTVAGNGLVGESPTPCPATAAKLAGPRGIVFDTLGNFYFSDVSGYVYKVDPAGMMSIFVGGGTDSACIALNGGDGGPASAACLGQPAFLAMDCKQNMYISDEENKRIRKVTADGIIHTIAGTNDTTSGITGDGGPATAATFRQIDGLAADRNGNVFIKDYGCLRKIDSLGIITTIAIDSVRFYRFWGTRANSNYMSPGYSLTTDIVGNVYTADYLQGAIRKIDTNGIVSTVEGTGFWSYSEGRGPRLPNPLNLVYGLCFNKAGDMIIAEGGNQCIRRLNASGTMDFIAGTREWGYSGDGGDPMLAMLTDCRGVAVDEWDNIYFTDKSNHRVRKITYETKFFDPTDSKRYCTVSPNQSAGSFTLSFTGRFANSVKVKIYNSAGVKVKEEWFDSSKPINITIDAPDGLYSMHIVSGPKTITGKIRILH